MTVMQYFHNQLNIRPQFPDLISVEVRDIVHISWCALIPYSSRRMPVPPGQLIRKEMSPTRSRDVPFLTNPSESNPTIIMGTPLTLYRTTRAAHALLIRGDMSPPPPGSRRGPGGYPSYTSIVGSINSTGTKYVSTVGVQDSLHELEDPETMFMVSVVHSTDPRSMLIGLNFSAYSSNSGKRWSSCSSAFYSIVVSRAILTELNLIRSPSLSFFPPSLLFVLLMSSLASSKWPTHRRMCATWFQTHNHANCCYQGPQSSLLPSRKGDVDLKGNCHLGTVIDNDVVSPVETDYYLYGHVGLLGTSKPAHHNVSHLRE